MLTVLLLVSACTQSINENIERGTEYLFREGYPEVRISAIGLFDEQGEPGINVTGDIVHASLVYKEADNKQTARVGVEIRIMESNDDKNRRDTTLTETFVITVSDRDESITRSQDIFSFDKRFPVPPGSYTVYVTVTDQNSRKHTTRQATTVIPQTDVRHPVLTNIQLLVKDNDSANGAYSPITTYEVPGRIDSLKFAFQVTNGDPDQPVAVESEFIRFASDTAHARPMSYPQPAPSTIAYKGIDYGDREIIQSSRRAISQTGSVLVEFIFPIQRRGNYRFTARAAPVDSGESVDEGEGQYKARDFGVRSVNYPALKTPRELARPLAYLMGEKEYKELLKIGDDDSLKRAIDRFWLKNLGNKSRARQVIALYYQRVLEANKQFPNFKEGWKTDRGMIYILFGRPMDYEQRLDRMVWYYSYNREDPRRTFLFTRPKQKHPAFPFEHYQFQRDFYYQNVQYQQVQRWLNGLILSGA